VPLAVARRFFVISSDTRADPHTVTTRPTSIDLDTGAPCGMRLPGVTILDSELVKESGHRPTNYPKPHGSA